MWAIAQNAIHLSKTPISNSQNGKDRKYSSKKWHVISARKPPRQTPQLTTKSPQLHHKKPSRKTHFSRDPPQKQQQKAAQIHTGRTSEKIGRPTSDS
jgi:hypothetical protein